MQFNVTMLYTYMWLCSYLDIVVKIIVNNSNYEI